MEEFAKKKGYDVVKIYKDEGYTGTNVNRPAFQKMLLDASIEPKQFDAVLLWMFDRFSRDIGDAAVNKERLRKEYEIDVISINESGENEEIDFIPESFHSVMAQNLSKTISKNCSRGLTSKAIVGLSTGGTTPVGYRSIHKSVGKAVDISFEIDDKYEPLIKRAFQMYISGVGAKQIAMTFNSEGILTPKENSWTAQKILFILKNEVYTGVRIWNRSSFRRGKLRQNDPGKICRYEGAHPAIIDKELFESVQLRLDSLNPRKSPVIEPRAIQSNYLLSGLLKCQCGNSFTGSEAKSGKYNYYSCVQQGKSGKTKCDMKLIPQKIIERTIIEYIKAVLLNEENISMLLSQINDKQKDTIKDKKDELTSINHELTDVRNKLTNIYTLIESGIVTEDTLNERIKERQLQIRNLEYKQNQLQNDIKNPHVINMSIADIRDFIIHCNKILNEASAGKKKELLRSFIEKINISWDGNNWKGSLKYKFPVPVKTDAGNNFIDPRNKVLDSVTYGRACATKPRTFEWCFLIKGGRRKGV